MRATDPGSVREEAERLVASVLAAASVAARGLGQPHDRNRPGGLSTGDDECCVCPLCKVIAAVRDPSPDFAERLATGAGDLAAGVASVLRNFTGGTTGWGMPQQSRTESSTEDSADTGTVEDPWQTATRAGSPPPPPRRKPMARKALKSPAQPATADPEATAVSVEADSPVPSAPDRAEDKAPAASKSGSTAAPVEADSPVPSAPERAGDKAPAASKSGVTAASVKAVSPVPSASERGGEKAPAAVATVPVKVDAPVPSAPEQRQGRAPTEPTASTTEATAKPVAPAAPVAMPLPVEADSPARAADKPAEGDRA